MIKTTTNDILKNGIKNRRDGYCYLVTPENYDFWCDFTNNCSSIQSLKTHRRGYLYFYGMKSIKYSSIYAEVDGIPYYKAARLQRILVEEKLLMKVN
jgi:hypothetical protein